MASDQEVTEKFEIRNRFTNAVQVTAEIVCWPHASVSVKLGLAIRWANLSGANLSGANLPGADLSGANLSWANLSWANLSGANLPGADLSGANLSGADLSGANLSGADLSGANLSRADLSGADLSWANLSGANLSENALRSFKADLFLTLSTLQAGPLDAQHLIAKLKAGKVDGSTYGRAGTECACLVGTIAQSRGVSGETLDHNSERPAERWFMMIKPGDVPGIEVDGKETGGGYAARIALEWTLDWCAAHGVDAEPIAVVEAVK